MSRLACSTSGVAAVHDRALVLYDGSGVRVGQQKLDKAADAVARFGDEWLVLAAKQKHLGRLSADGSMSPFAAGKAVIGVFAVGRDDAVALARGEVVELWSRDEDRCWSTKGASPVQQIVVGRDHVVALGQDGALYFFSREKGEALGALRLASPEPANEWRLAHVDGVVVVLALGEWLVWIDASTRQTVRRVRARARVLEVAADGEHVAVAVEDGVVQAFRAKSGEPRASISMDGGGVSDLALGPAALFTLGKDGDAVRSRDRQTLDVTVRAASPVSSITARGRLAAVGDRSGRVRVLEALGGDLREVGAFASGEGSSGLFLTTNECVVAASPRVVMRFSPPWSSDAGGAA
ncbi:MAG TPA: hypothetical protein VM925_35885, partial [Labilithrix sp.]|nr:hypothetical protein [Labilithrix sp.]